MKRFLFVGWYVLPTTTFCPTLTPQCSLTHHTAAKLSRGGQTGFADFFASVDCGFSLSHAAHFCSVFSYTLVIYGHQSLSTFITGNP